MTERLYAANEEATSEIERLRRLYEDEVSATRKALEEDVRVQRRLEAENARLRDLCDHQRHTLYFLEGADEDGAELHASDARHEEVTALRAEVERLRRLVEAFEDMRAAAARKGGE